MSFNTVRYMFLIIENYKYNSVIYYIMTFIRRLKTKTGTYLVKVKNEWKDGKVVQKHLGVVGKIENGKEILYGQIHDSEIREVSVAGSILALSELCRELGLGEILDSYTDYRSKWLMALVLAHCTKPTSINRMKRWCKKYGVNDLLDLQSHECNKDRFCSALDELNAKSIMKIEKDLFKRISYIVKPKKDSLFYDVTSTYFCGTQCSIAKSGYNSEGIGLPQINIGLAITRQYGFPIFHQVFDGNIQDIRSIDQTLRTLKDYGIKNTILVWDRGMTSKNSILAAKKQGLDVVVGLPLRGEIKRKAIQMKEKISTIDNRTRLTTQILYTKGYNSNVYGIKGKVVVCFNEREASVLKELRYDEIENALQRLERGLSVKERIKKFIDMKQREVNKHALLNAELTDGLYALFSTNTSLSSKNIVKIYFQKDRIEKAFQYLKSMIKVRPVRHWLTDRVRAHVFICYLSYTLFSMLEWKLKSRNIEMSIGEAIETLENIYRVKVYDPKTGNSFVKHSVMSKQQESIMKAINRELVENLV